MKARVDQDLCIGCGLCAGCAPDVFVIDEDAEKAKVIGEGDDAAVQEAIDSCPFGAISQDD